MSKNKFFLLLFLLLMTSLSFAQKTTLTFNVIAYVEQKTADYFGGKQAIQDSIASNWIW